MRSLGISNPLKWAIGLVLLGVMILATLYMGSDKMMNFLLPGDLEQIQRAASQMLEHLRAGVPLGPSIRVFCEEIIANGLQKV